MVNIYSKRYDKILVPLDGSENSKRALIEAICFSKHTKSTITGIYVIKSEHGGDSIMDMLTPLSAIEDKGYETKKLNEANQIMKKANDLCIENKIEFKGIATNGNPPHKIIQYGEKNNFDLTIMGMRGKSHLSEVLLGSVSYHVLHKSTIPVLLVK